MWEEATTEELNFIQYFRFFLMNQERVTHLLHISQQCDSLIHSDFSTTVEEDILRSAVVLNHASLDQLLRQIARYRVANSGKKHLKMIPLWKELDSEQDSNTKSTTLRKFYLSDLYELGSKTVGQVILKSIIAYYSRKSFNSTDDIAKTLETELDIEISSLRSYFPILTEMMKRRHQIVHNADNDASKDILSLQPIIFSNVKLWVDVTKEFGINLAKIIINHPNIDQLVKNYEERHIF